MESAGRILILVENLSVPFDRRVWLEATTLRRAGYAVSVICPRGKKCDTAPEAEIDGIHIYRYTLPACQVPFLAHVLEYVVAMTQTARLTWKVFRGAGFDVIHACNPPDLFWLIAAPYCMLGRRFVFDQHDLSPEIFKVQFARGIEISEAPAPTPCPPPPTSREGEPGSGCALVPPPPGLGEGDRGWGPAVKCHLSPLAWPVYGLLRLLEKTTYRLSHAVIATNETMRAIARERGPVPDERIFTVRTGPDFGRLQLVPADESLRAGRPHLVCYLGVMGKQDGVDYALRAAQQLLCRRPGCARFAFIGDGDHAPALRALARELGIEEDVEFTGRVSDADLVRYLSTADVCLSPDPANGFNEFHTMNKTMEYMAMGKPVVAFDLVETRTSAGAAALYARPNDIAEFASHVERLLDDPALREQLGREGRRRVEEALCWEHSAPHLLATYAAVLRRPAPRAAGVVLAKRD
jgi:glycosyl transferase family 1/glycosyl transferase family 4